MESPNDMLNNTLNSVEISSLLRKRHSSRVMDPTTPVPKEMIHQLLEAARWAPSSGNYQPWNYIIFDNSVPDAFQKARECLNISNQAWANQAPVLILALAEEIRSNTKINAKAQHDLGLANENLLLQATALGLNGRPMGGFDTLKARSYFNIPDNFIPIVMIAIGYPGDITTLPEEVQNKETEPRSRKEISEFTHMGEWSGSYLIEEASYNHG